MSSGVSELRGIVAQLQNLGEKVSDNCLIGAILSSLPSRFDIFVTVWKNSATKDVDGLVSKLMAEANEQEAKDKEDTKALSVKQKGKKRDSKNDRNYGKSNKGQDERPKLPRDQCIYCKESGYWIRECPNLKTPYDPNRSKKKRENGKSKDNDLAFIAKVASIKAFSMDTWVADSGCTHHMTPFKSLIVNFSESSDISKIGLADDKSSLSVKGVGSVITEHGRLKQVLYVPELAQNLFSLSVARSNGLEFRSAGKDIKFYHQDRELFTAHSVKNLYLIKFKICGLSSGNACGATLKEWHSRFGHVSTETIKQMIKNKVVSDLDIVAEKSEKCEDCQLNKCSRAHHPSKTSVKAKKAGQVLHIDTAGPSNVKSSGGSNYFVLCKDEFSRYKQVAFVESKAQISTKIKEFISNAILETRNDVLKLVTDNGTEYVNSDLSKFLQAKGIIHETSVPYNPAQNGLIERDIRTIKESARTLLNNSKLNKNLWPEAINCAAYSLNRAINAANSIQTPYELWFGVKPSVKNLHTFGELAILKKPDRKMTSWEEKGSPGTFLGYTEKFNTFRFLIDGKVTRACDCVFIGKMFNGEEIRSTKTDDFWVDLTDQENLVSLDDSVQENVFQDTIMQLEKHDAERVNETPVNEPQNQLIDIHDQQSRNQEIVEVQLSANPPRIQLDDTLVQNFVDRNRNLKAKITVPNGNSQSISIGSMQYSDATQRWRTDTGHFISRYVIKQIMDQVNRSSTQLSRVLLASSIFIPSDYREAIESDNKQQWLDAMSDEMQSLNENQVYEEINSKSIDKKPVSSRWVFTVKYKQNGEVEKFKARVVARGFSQVYGLDYHDTYCSVVQIMSTRLIFNYAALNCLQIRQFDIKTAFLYGSLDEEIFMQPPEGYVVPGTIWKLKRSLYGLKQSPRMWNKKFSEFLESINFSTGKYDQSIFYRVNPLTIILVYVDDGLIFARGEEEIEDVLQKLQANFKMRELEVTLYRGLEIVQQQDGIFIHQENYAKKVLESFNMSEANPAQNPMCQFDGEENEPLQPNVPYRKTVGCLAYLADYTRPDMAFTVNVLARKLSSPTVNDWKLVKHVLRYLSGTRNCGIKFSNQTTSGVPLLGYSDSDFAADKSAKSTTGFVLLFNGAAFHWKTQLQKHVTLSSTEAEVIALCALAKEMSWIRRLCIELRLVPEQPSVIRCDNQSALKVVQSEKATARTRHLRAQDSYVREQIEMAELQIEHVKSEKQLADLLTKFVPTKKFIANRDVIMKQNTNV